MVATGLYGSISNRLFSRPFIKSLRTENLNGESGAPWPTYWRRSWWMPESKQMLLKKTRTRAFLNRFFGFIFSCFLSAITKNNLVQTNNLQENIYQRSSFSNPMKLEPSSWKTKIFFFCKPDDFNVFSLYEHIISSVGINFLKVCDLYLQYLKA